MTIEEKIQIAKELIIKIRKQSKDFQSFEKNVKKDAHIKLLVPARITRMLIQAQAHLID